MEQPAEVWKARGETLEKKAGYAKPSRYALQGRPLMHFGSRSGIFSTAWLLSHYEVRRAYALGNNIYQVRETGLRSGAGRLRENSRLRAVARFRQSSEA